MIAKLNDDGFIYLDLVTSDMESLLLNRFSAADPRSRYSTQYELGTWDGRTIRYSVKKQRLSIAFLTDLRKLCEEQNIPFDVVDERSRPKYFPIPEQFVTNDLLPGITLTDYQIRALKAIRNSERGIVSAPTGSGKGELLAATVQMFPGCPTAILAEEIIVASQIKERLELREVVEEVGAFYAGERPNGQIVVVGSIQALRSPPESARKSEIERTGNDKAWQTRTKNAKYLQDIIKKCHLVMVDEVDRASSDSYADLLTKFAKSARYVYGFSGTPFDEAKPVQNLLLRERFGEIIIEISRKEVEALGRIIPVKYVMLAIGENGNKYDKTDNNTAIKDFMINNTDLHDKINAICNTLSDDGTLVLVESIELGQILEQKIANSVFISGSTPVKARNDAIKRFESREIRVLIGSKILRRGLDLKGGCENLVLCYDGKMSSEFIQRIGRALRLNKKGWARVFDFLFLNNYYLYNHSKKRLGTLVKLGYNSTVMLNNTTITGEELIKRKWRLPKSKV